MHSSVFFKEHDLNTQNFMNGGALSSSTVPLWTGLGFPPSHTVVYGDGEATTIQSKQQVGSLGLSAGYLENNNSGQFTLFSVFDLGDCKTAENGMKTQQAAITEYHRGGQFELGFGQPLICAKYPYADPCYGVYSPAQIGGRIMLPLSMTTDGGPIYVNAKQYNGIMRRRKKRTKLEMENKLLKLRKPFMHMSRHLHAMRRPRGNGGRFLNTKKSKATPKVKTQQISQLTGSQSSEVLEYDLGINLNGTNSSRSTSPGSEVTSHLFPNTTSFHPHHAFQTFPDMANTGLEIGMGTGNYLMKV